MVIRDISKINIPNYIWKARKKINKDYPIIGFDTETGGFNNNDNNGGKCILICDSNKRLIIPNHIDELLNFLMYKPYQYSINFFYNVKYDTNAIIKMLPDNHKVNLALFDETVYYDRNLKQYFISIIPDKLLKIRVGHHTVKFFDLAQFYNKRKLKHLAKKVNMSKFMLDNIENLDKKQMLEDEKYRNDVIKRCFIDSVIAQKLGLKLHNTISKFVRIKNYYSGASISRQLVLQNLNDKYLNLPSLKFMDMALKAYNAGRFEILKRGYFPSMIERDINSAYPYEIANLTNCEGVYIYNKEYIPDSTHSFFNCDLEIYDTNYSPFKFQLPKSKKEMAFYDNLPTNLLIYPTGKFKNQFLSKSDYETIYNMGYPIKINYAGHIINKNPEKIFNYVEDIYYYRKDLQHGNKNKKIEKDTDLADTIKRGLNSIYGTFINVNSEKGLTQKETEFTNNFTIINNEVWFSKDKTTAGNMFNPVFATEICSNVRNKLYNDFIPYEDKIICIATDGIKLTADVNIKESNKLGGYDKSKLTEGILIGSGVYQFGDETKFRGFVSYKTDENKKADLKTLLQTNKNNNIIPSIVNRVINLKYAYKNNYIKLIDDDGKTYNKHLTLDDINRFVKINRELDINFDKKRVWDRQFKNCSDVLENIIDSKPINIE